MTLETELQKILAGLTPREREVLKERFGIDLDANLTPEQLAAVFDKTRNRIREIEKKALKRLKDKNDPDSQN